MMPNADLDTLLRDGIRPDVTHVAHLMGAVVRPSLRDGYVEYVNPVTETVVGVTKKDPASGPPTQGDA